MGKSGTEYDLRSVAETTVDFGVRRSEFDSGSSVSGGADVTQLTTALAPGRWPTGPGLRSLSITATCTLRATERVDDRRADLRLDISPLTSKRSSNWNQDSDCQQQE